MLWYATTTKTYVTHTNRMIKHDIFIIGFLKPSQICLCIADISHKDNYIGCFRSNETRGFGGITKKFEKHLTTGRCSTFCFKKGYLYSATKNK